MPMQFTGSVLNGTPVDVLSSDGNNVLASGTADVERASLKGLTLHANYAVVTDQQSGFVVNQYDASGSFAVTAAVASNTATFDLSNATTRIVVDQLPVTIKGANAKTLPATISIDLGVLGDIELANGTDALLSNDDPVLVQNIDGSVSVNGEADIVDGVPQVILPADWALIQAGVLGGVNVIGTYDDTITVTGVSGGKVTEITLS